MLPLILLHCIAMVNALETYKTYNNYSLLSVTCATSDQVQYLQTIEKKEVDEGTFGVQLWQEATVGQTTDVLVHPHCLDEFLDELRKKKITFVITTDNVGQLLETEMSSKPRQDAADKYLTLQEVEDYLDTLKIKYAGLVTTESIGATYENRSITVVKIGSQSLHPKQAVWIDGGIHAREWIAPATVLHLMTKLLTEDLSNYTDAFDWYFLPVMNPDGYHYTHTVDRMWRKNRRRGPCRCFAWVKYCCDGVDLNRNFDYQWGGAGSSKSPCDYNYRGPSAFSEPESVAVRDFLLKNKNNTLIYLTLHSYGQVWAYPFSDRVNSYPSDHEELDALSKKATRALETLHGSKYRVGTAADILYPTTGSSADWAKATANIKYVFGVELRPDNDRRQRRTGFIVPPHEIRQSGEEIWTAVKILVDSISAT